MSRSNMLKGFRLSYAELGKCVFDHCEIVADDGVSLRAVSVIRSRVSSRGIRFARECNWRVEGMNHVRR